MHAPVIPPSPTPSARWDFSPVRWIRAAGGYGDRLPVPDQLEPQVLGTLLDQKNLS
jgi:hypothetical protein